MLVQLEKVLPLAQKSSSVPACYSPAWIHRHQLHTSHSRIHMHMLRLLSRCSPSMCPDTASVQGGRPDLLQLLAQALLVVQ